MPTVREVGANPSPRKDDHASCRDGAGLEPSRLSNLADVACSFGKCGCLPLELSVRPGRQAGGWIRPQGCNMEFWRMF